MFNAMERSKNPTTSHFVIFNKLPSIERPLFLPQYVSAAPAIEPRPSDFPSCNNTSITNAIQTNMNKTFKIMLIMLIVSFQKFIFISYNCINIPHHTRYCKCFFLMLPSKDKFLQVLVLLLQFCPYHNICNFQGDRLSIRLVLPLQVHNIYHIMQYSFHH